MRVIRTHDGVAFEFTNQHLTHVDRLSALLDILGPAMDIEAHNLILMNSLGSQLTDKLLRPILDAHRSPSASATTNNSLPTPSSSKALIPHHQSLSFNQDPAHFLYAFDRKYLSADPDKVSKSLQSAVEDVLEPSVRPFDPDADKDPDVITSLAAAHQTLGSAHLRTTLLLLSHIRAQKAGLEVALNNLDKFRESPKGAWEAFETFAQPQVDAYGTLLEAYAPALALARRVKIHPQLLSANTLTRTSTPNSTAVGSSGPVVTKSKYMGDYVMEDRITQIRDRCLKVYEDLCAGFTQIRASSTEVDEGAMALRNAIDSVDCDLDDMDPLEKDAEDGFQRVEEIVPQITQFLPDEKDALIEIFGELMILDDDSRERVAFLVWRKNFWIPRIIGFLNRISELQGIMSSIGSDVQALNTELRTRTESFKHLARLKDFVTAYASTVVEVVRRREYARHLLSYASALANSLSKLSADERKRRTTYRAEYGGKMPFAVEGLEDVNVPTIEFEIRHVGTGSQPGGKPKESVRNVQGVGDLPQLTRADVDDLITSLRNIEETSDDERDPEQSLIKGPAHEVRLLVEKQFSRLEHMENAFAEAVERIVIADSESALQSRPIDPDVVDRLQAQVTELQATNNMLVEERNQVNLHTETSTRKFQSDLKLSAQKIDDLKLQLLHAKDESREECERVAAERNSLTQEHNDLLLVVQTLRSQVSKLEEDLKTRTKSLQDVERQLASARATADDATKELHDLEARHRDQLVDHGMVLNQFQQSRDRSAELEDQLHQALNNNQELSNSVRTKDELMEEHLSEADRVRKQMESEMNELRARFAEQKELNGDMAQQIKQHQSHIEQLTRESQAQADTFADMEKQSAEDAQQVSTRLETHCQNTVRMIQKYQSIHCTIIHRIQSIPRPGSSLKSATGPSGPSIDPTAAKQNSDPSDSGSQSPASGLAIPAPLSPEFNAFMETLSQHDPEAIIELVQSKLDHLSLTVRKWMKESKGYRERAVRAQEQAHVRITFRDFAKGDLALFLPTRNPTAQVWAAFNVSFPHYFLQANDVVAPIIKSREWLVARIISLTEKMVDAKEPETNPYALPAGTRYFLLEVEPWSVEKNPRKVTQSVIGLGNLSPVKKHSPSRSVTLPAQMSPLATSSLPKGSNDEEVCNIEERRLPLSQPILPLPPNLRAGDDSTSSPPHTAPSHTASDLTQSGFTVIDTPPSPSSNDPGGDSPFASPFRAIPSSPSSRRVGPSALSLSLAKGYQKSPLSHLSASAQPGLVPLSEVGPDKGGLDSLQPATEFRPSESARPAFLSNVSVTSSQSRRTNFSSTLQPPLKPRLRPVPKANAASRSTSRSSLASSSNLSPAIKALLKPGSPSSKSLSTVSTTMISSEKNPASTFSNSDIPSSQILSTALPNSSGGRPASTTPSKDKTKRRLSFPGSNSAGMMFQTNGASTSSPSNSSMSGSVHHINPRPDGQLSRSPSLNATATMGVAPNGMSAGGGGGLSTSLFGTWRKRKESLVMPGSFVGASELLKRFSSQNPSPPKP